MKQNLSLSPEAFLPVHTGVEAAALPAGPALRVVKKDKLLRFDENTYARARGITFRDGILELKMKSRLLPDAPDFARGFIGVVFRANEENSEFESFYLRPTNGRSCPDPVRRTHGCQYFSYPGYTFEYFREFGIPGYEAPADIELDEWFTLKAVIQGSRAEFYLNGAEQPLLVVPSLKHGTGAPGGVGIFVDIGTEAFVSEFTVTPLD